MTHPSQPAADAADALGRGQGDFASAIREQTAGYARNRQQDIVRAVSDVANVIRDSGSSFDRVPHVKAFFDNAADGVGELAADIDRRTLTELYDEVEAAIRRRPGVALASAALAGFALVRFVRGAGPRPVPRSRAVVPIETPATPGSGT
ncbi:hypothetical protein [Methylobacterium brachythecii]|uniref:DUF3618 domain-containing protein n=1 Tax=Methylobacterium brachythecii TaxID=1176177 RepID=A0A7W6F879_9HYPH|nr:hypothetical protein [Methylobacterium brachythecii]MBB3904207.1 hypothetical protein [Methylobacterium brachythecii]